MNQKKDKNGLLPKISADLVEQSTASARRAEAKRRPVKRSEQVARQMVKDIVFQNLKDGEKLPNELELVKQYGVSRASLREAVRLLEVQGLITVRPGPGKTEVGRVDAANLSNTLALYLLMGRISLDHLLDAWLTVEPILARMAASSMDREKVKRFMTPFVEEGVHEKRELGAGLAFHDTVAELAENEVLRLLFAAIGFLVTEQVRIGARGFTLSDETLHAHDVIAKCIMNGDEDGAYITMREHIELVIQEIRTAMPGSNRTNWFFP